MKVVATNIGTVRTVVWNKEEITTGIYKHPVDEPIFLGKEGVREDHVVDRRYHGGVDKACYVYSADFYPQWQALFPYLEWSHGMFGENLTIEGINDEHIRIGDIFQLGKTKVQVSEPRQPCKKLNIRFNSKEMVKQFVGFGQSGFYLRVLEEGLVDTDDSMILLESNPESLTVQDVFKLIYTKTKKPELLEKALNDPYLSESAKQNLKPR